MPLRTLADPAAAEAVLTRLQRLTPDAKRRWGTMTPNEMLCHLADAFGTGLGERSPKPISVFGLRGPMARWISLSLPLPWPHGIRGPAEVDPKRTGTKPSQFAGDHDRVMEMARRFIDQVGDQYPHPIFGRMTRSHWLRWGWLHLDHHLRQFCG
jgi:hypothetical protein